MEPDSQQLLWCPCILNSEMDHAENRFHISWFPFLFPNEHYYKDNDPLNSRLGFFKKVFITQQMSPGQVEAMTGRNQGMEKRLP